jgi:peroxiredoxin
MKKHVSLLIAACIAVLLLLPACQQPNKTTSLASLATPATGATHVTGSRIGNAAPDFSLLDTDGRTVKLSSLLGRPVFINFWSIEWAFCVGELPSLQAVYKEESAQSNGVAFLTINVEDTAQAVKAFMTERSYTMPALLGKETDILAKYNVANKPASFFIDRQGVIRSFKLGPFIDEKDLKSFFSEKTISVSDTAQPGSIRLITSQELAQILLAAKSLPPGTEPASFVIDTRDSFAYYDAALQGVINIPPAVPGYPSTYEILENTLKKAPLNKIWVFYDQDGSDDGAAMRLAQQLLALNFGHEAKNIGVLQGGLADWLKLGYPLNVAGCSSW